MALRTPSYAAPCLPLKLATGMALLVALVAGAPMTASAEYVRDGIRINLRTRPGEQYRIVKTLASGDQVSTLGEKDEWTQVRVDNGEQTIGWVPKRFLTNQLPASVALPRAESQLAATRQKLKALEAKLGTQAEAVLEVETLRARNATLETENLQIAGAERWRSLGMGAVIALGGVLIGVLWPRGSNRGGRRIKL